MKRVFIILFLLQTTSLFSQSKADSLQLEFEKAVVDSIKIKILNQLFYQYQNNSPVKAKEMVKEALHLLELSNDKSLQVNSYNQYPDFLILQVGLDDLKKTLSFTLSDHIRAKVLNQLGSKYTFLSSDTASIYLNKALSLASKKEYLLEKAEALLQLTRIYRLLGDYPKALECGFDALKIFTASKNQSRIPRLLTNIGNVYFRLEDYPEALNYQQQSLQIAKQLNDELAQGVALVNMGIVYENINQPEKAFENYFNALSVNRRIGPKINISINLENIGDLYFDQGKYDIALPYFFESLELSKEISDQQGIASISRHIAEIYQKQGKVKKSMDYATFSLEVASKNKLKTEAAAASLILSDNYNHVKDFKNALEFYRSHKIYRDSLYNEANLKKLQNIENRYEIQQKEQELTIKGQTITLLERNKQINKLWRNILLVSLLALILIGFLIYKFLRANNRKDKALLLVEQANTEQLETLDKAKSRFFANISHEFRTPLTLIKGPIEQLEQNPDKALGIDNIKMIRRNANRVLNMVNQLLDLSKIDEGSLKLAPTEGDIYKCLRAATSSFNSHAAQRNIDYRVQIPQTVLWASFDRNKVENIVYNLLSNAFKFTDENSKISFSVLYNGSRLQIQVSDSGKGIPQEKLPFIFDRFYQVDSSTTKEKEGSGIGLSLSKNLIELMGGTINVSSKLNRGTFFTVLLPLEEIRTGRQRARDFVPQIEKSAFKKPFTILKTDKRDVPSILLVEDNKDMRHFIMEQLIKFYKIKEAIDGKSGLKAAIADPPDLVITDLMMPKMDGIELCKELKTDVNTSHIPVIMLTAKAGMDNKIEGLETGADDYLTKPFDVNELLVRIKNLIEQRQKLRELYSNKEVQIDPKKVTLTSIDQKFLEQVLELLESKFSDSDFGVPQMQEALGMSKTQLHRKLKALTNEAPGELLRNFRLKRAAQLLSQKADTVTQIAYLVGFNNLSYFAKCFKELYGTAPSAYKTRAE